MTLPIPNTTTAVLIGIGGAALVASIIYASERAETQRWVDACEATYGTLGDVEQRTIRQIVQCFKRYGDGDPRKLAYILATVDAECSFVSKEEHETSTNIYRLYWTSGYKGRGLVQLTGENNYRKASELLGVDFVSYPEKVIELRYAVPILVRGMMTGMFSRRKLGDYINKNETDFYNARRVVNWLDKASIIANNAISILDFYQS